MIFKNFTVASSCSDPCESCDPEREVCNADTKQCDCRTSLYRDEQDDTCKGKIIQLLFIVSSSGLTYTDLWFQPIFQIIISII